MIVIENVKKEFREFVHSDTLRTKIESFSSPRSCGLSLLRTQNGGLEGDCYNES